MTLLEKEIDTKLVLFVEKILKYTVVFKVKKKLQYEVELLEI